MPASFGSSTPPPLGNGASVPTFPQTARIYTALGGAVVVPGGALDRWYAYRATRGAARGDVIGLGDSTMYGAGGLYSFLTRLRTRSVTAGMTDGGKGMFAGGEGFDNMLYDSPEINGWVSQTFGGGFPDGADNTDGQYYYDAGVSAGNTLVLQFRTTAARLWYSNRSLAGDFTYSVDGGATVTVQAYAASGTTSRFQYISGLTAGTTHTITITNLATSTIGGGANAKACYIALAPVNNTGIIWNKYATSGDTINKRFYGGVASAPYTQTLNVGFQSPFGLEPAAVTAASGYTGAGVLTGQPAGGTINPVLAMTNLGFNDLTSAAAGDETMWTESVKRFAGACRDARCDGIVITGQLPYNANWPTYGATRYQALKDQALASGLAFIDSFYPIGGPSLSYAGGTQNPHLGKTQYQTQADFIWDNLLGL